MSQVTEIATQLVLKIDPGTQRFNRDTGNPEPIRDHYWVYSKNGDYMFSASGGLGREVVREFLEFAVSEWNKRQPSDQDPGAA